MKLYKRMRNYIGQPVYEELSTADLPPLNLGAWQVLEELKKRFREIGLTRFALPELLKLESQHSDLADLKEKLVQAEAWRIFRDHHNPDSRTFWYTDQTIRQNMETALTEARKSLGES